MISIQLTSLEAEALISGLPTAVGLEGRKQYYDRFPCANPGGGVRLIMAYTGLRYMKKVGISQNEVYKRVRKLVI